MCANVLLRNRKYPEFIVTLNRLKKKEAGTQENPRHLIIIHNNHAEIKALLHDALFVSERSLQCQMFAAD